jgi:hypothetical protein
MRYGPAVEAVVELIAVDTVAIEIGAAFLAMIVVVVVAFSLHNSLLQRAVQRCQAELRAQRAQAAAATPVVADRPRSARLAATTTQEHWAETRQAGATENNTVEPPLQRPASPRAAAR